jgi:peroxiredoxin
MTRAIKELQDSKIMDKVLTKGDKAPDFTLENSHGIYINLNDILSSGPVVPGFYRGRW